MIRTPITLLLALLSLLGLSLVQGGPAGATATVTLSSDHRYVGADFDSTEMKNTPSRGLTTVVLTTLRTDVGYAIQANGQKNQNRTVCLAVRRIVTDTSTGDNVGTTDQYGGHDLGEDGCVETTVSGLSIADDLTMSDVNVASIPMTHTSLFCCDSSGEYYATYHPAGTASVVAHWHASEALRGSSFCLTPSATGTPSQDGGAATLYTFTFRHADTITARVNGVSPGTPALGEDTDTLNHRTTSIGCPSGTRTVTSIPPGVPDF